MTAAAMTAACSKMRARKLFGSCAKENTTDTIRNAGLQDLLPTRSTAHLSLRREIDWTGATEVVHVSSVFVLSPFALQPPTLSCQQQPSNKFCCRNSLPDARQNKCILVQAKKEKEIFKRSAAQNKPCNYCE